MLNALWIGFFLVAALVGLGKLLLLGDPTPFVDMMNATFASSKTAFQVALGLVGVMTFWLGLLRVAERAGFLNLLTRILNPLFRRLFREVPEGHPALGAMTMNIAANMLGLDNAATPIGLKAMQALQTLNPSTVEASNAQILFLVKTASSVTLLPITVFTYRAQMGARDPTDVFVPILLATYVSMMVGLALVSAYQRINLFDRVIFAYLAGLGLVVGAMVYYFGHLAPAEMARQSALVSDILLFSLIIAFIAGAALKGVNVYEAFIDGAKDGFATAVAIVPYLVAMLVAVGVFRASGALHWVLSAIRGAALDLGLDTRFVGGLPTAFLKPLSGSAARAMVIDTMRVHGADSFAGRLACVVQGSTETTFYVLAVYLGAAGLKQGRHAVVCALGADLAGMVAAIFLTYFFFGGSAVSSPSSITSTTAPLVSPSRTQASASLARASAKAVILSATGTRAAAVKNSMPSLRVRLATERMLRSPQRLRYGKDGISLMWMPAHTTVPPLASPSSALGTRWPLEAKMIAASRAVGAGSSEPPAHRAPSSRAKACLAASLGRVKA